MSLHWQPAGPLPPATYWRRRVLLALVLLLVILGIRWALPGGPKASPQDPLGVGMPTPTPTDVVPTSTDPPIIGPTAPEAPPPPCVDRDLVVTAAADAASYRVGARPRLQLTVRNASRTACQRALGQGAVELRVFSGRDRIWSSDDCAPGGPQGPLTLGPGQEHRSTLVWSGARSRPGCDGAKQAAQPGTYRVVARVGALVREGSSFQLRA
ncbi:MAG TPA: hypothetical protein VNA30_06825 [Mycobacteriales bacterium]|nr:hypothetical protein [Mycobacteriales bacterium]